MLLKKTFFILLFISTLSAFPQFFTGDIVYKEIVIPKTDTTELSDWAKTKHERITKHIQSDSNYRTIRYDKDGSTFTSTYNSRTKLIYNDFSNQDYITYEDSRYTSIEYKEPQIFKDSTKVITGKNSYFVITNDAGTKAFCFYTNDIKINPLNFKGFAVDNWVLKLNILEGAILLEEKIEYSDFYVIKTAIEINERIVKPKEFELPTERLVGAAIMTLDKKASLIPLDKSQFDCYKKLIKHHTPSTKGKQPLSYVHFFLTKEGEMKYLKPQYKDDSGDYKIALKIINKCEFKFKPGQINNKEVDSRVFFGVPYPK